MFSQSNKITYFSTEDKNFDQNFKDTFCDSDEEESDDDSQTKESNNKLRESRSFFIESSHCFFEKCFLKEEHYEEGGYGVVYIFSETVSGEKKMVKEMIIKKENDLKAFQLETALFQKANGYCILQKSNNIVRLFMKKLPGKTLYAISPKNTNQFIKIFISIIKKAMNLHRKKIIHGDLSFGNILIHANKHISDNYISAYFCDFGFARYIGELTSGNYAKSYPYNAPELRDEIPADPSQDVYSLGMILQELQEKVLNRTFLYTNQIRTLCHQMTRLNPKQRISLEFVLDTCQRMQNAIKSAKSASTTTPQECELECVELTKLDYTHQRV